MTIVHPPSTDRETDAIESLDFAPPCQHPKGCDHSAEWIVWRKPKPCGCPARPFLYCDPHLQRRLRATRLTCSKCGISYSSQGMTLRVERI